MPELPEVEYVVRTVRDGQPSLIGRRIEQARVLSENVVSGPVGEFAARVQGCTFKSVRRYGKYIICGLDTMDNSSELWFVIHLRMTGRLHMIAASETVGRHTRLILSLDQGLVLHFDDPRKFGRVVLTGNLAVITGKLGPDALHMTEAEFCRRLQNIRRTLKPLLLDQSFVCGIGNIYTDEILFRAGVHPLTSSSSLDASGIKTLYSAVTSVLVEAVSAGGANIDGVFKAGNFVTNVYGRENKPCRKCGTSIVKIKVSQRGTHLCPQCQIL